jgi:hypothetical protein
MSGIAHWVILDSPPSPSAHPTAASSDSGVIRQVCHRHRVTSTSAVSDGQIIVARCHGVAAHNVAAAAPLSCPRARRDATLELFK